MSSPNNDPLAGYYVDEQPESEVQSVKPPVQKEDPLAKYYVNEQTGEREVSREPDYVSKNLREQGYEPDFSEEIERLGSRGEAEWLKGVLSGTSVGLSEKPEFLGIVGQFLPDLKPEESAGAEFGKVVGSLLPISKVLQYAPKPLRYLAQKSPYFAKSLGILAEITGVGLGGAGYGAAEHVLRKGELPSSKEVLENGFEWGLLEAALRSAGATGSFAYNLIKSATKQKKAPFKLVNEVNNALREAGVELAPEKRVGDKALSIIEDIAEEKPVKGNLKERVSDQQLKKMDDSVSELAEPILPEAKEVSITNLTEDFRKDSVRNRIESIGKKTVDDSELGKQVQDAVNANLKERIESYKPLYDEVKEKAQIITASPTTTADTAGDLLLALEKLKTKPAGYATVIKTIEDVLSDIGYKVQRNKSGVIENIIQDKSNIGMDKLIELGRRLNEVVEYDVLDATVKDRIKPIVTRVKSDIRKGLGAYDKDILAAFELAEEAAGLKGARFGRKSVRSIRGNEALESIPKSLESSTALQDLREVVDGKTMKNIERHLLEKMNGMKEETAQKFLRQIRSGLSKESQKLADDIVTSKKPFTKQSTQTQRQNYHDMIDADLNQSMLTGKRPSKTLSLWQEPRGRKIVQEALETNPQKKQLTDYLQKQTLQDMAKSVIKDGKIDAAKLNELMKNKAIQDNLRDLGGQEAVDFFRDLSSKINNLRINANKLGTETLKIGEKIEKTSGEKGKQLLTRMANADYPLAGRIRRALDSIGFTGKATLNLLTVLKFGYLKGALIPVGANLLLKMATNPRVRKAFNEAAKKNLDPLAFITAIEALGNSVDEAD